jgi:hypothetical protein
MSTLIDRQAINSKEYERLFLHDTFSNEPPAPDEFETTKQIVDDSVTFKLGEDTYVVSALKKGHLTVERTGIRDDLIQEQKDLVENRHSVVYFMDQTGVQIGNPRPGTAYQHIKEMERGRVSYDGLKGYGNDDVGVKVLKSRTLTTQDLDLWARLEYLRQPLQEIVFKVPRGLKIKESERRELQKRIEALLLGTKGLTVPLGTEEPKRFRLPWRKKAVIQL